MELIIRDVAVDSPDFRGLTAALDVELEQRYPGLGDDLSEPPPPLAAAVVAYADGAPVGCAALRLIEPGVGEVTRMFVAPQGRRAGVARRMLTAIESRGVALGYSTVRLGTGLRQPEAIALYESSGYRRIHLFGDYEGGPCACFEKRLESRACCRTSVSSGRRKVD